LAAGYADGTFKLWDIKEQSHILHILPEKTRELEDQEEVPQALTTIATDNENHLIVAGSENGRTKLIGPSGLLGILATQQISSIPGSSGEQEASPIEKVLIDCPNFEVKVAATGSLDGRVMIWDVAHQTVRNECVDENPAGITT
jgi:ribosome assembly protein SQT1